MPTDPTKIIGEILGEPAAEMRNPVNLDYECPYMNSTCMKRSQGIEGSYPVCSIWKKNDLVCVCPKRFFEIALLDDVLKYAWVGNTPPTNPQIVYEIKMKGFGNVDCVVADIGPNNQIKQFVSVELQAVDITGSCLPAYEAVLNSQILKKSPSYGLNYANVYKRFISQLIVKGYYHHHWQTKIVAVMQDVIFKNIQERYPFPEVDAKNANIVFLIYKFVKNGGSEKHSFVFDKVIRTHHTNLQNAVLYKNPPSKDEFCRYIQNRLSRG